MAPGTELCPLVRDGSAWRPDERGEEAEPFEARDVDFEGEEDEEEEAAEEVGEERKVPFAALLSVSSAADRSLPYVDFLGGMTVDLDCSKDGKLSLKAVEMM